MNEGQISWSLMKILFIVMINFFFNCMLYFIICMSSQNAVKVVMVFGTVLKQRTISRSPKPDIGQFLFIQYRRYLFECWMYSQ